MSEYTSNLKSMIGEFKSKIDVLTGVENLAKSKLDNDEMKTVAIKGAELKKAIDSAMSGDTSILTNFVSNNANPN